MLNVAHLEHFEMFVGALSYFFQLTYKLSFGSRSFAVAAPTIWNTIPLDIRNSPSMCCFRRRLKTFFYNLVFRPS